MRRYRAKAASSIPCVDGQITACDRSDSWRHRHSFVAFHDGRRGFNAIAPHLESLREKYRASGGRLLVWTNVREVLPRTFSAYYMWSYSDSRNMRQLSFDEWLRSHNELDAHVTGLGVPIDRRECSTAQLASVLSLFDALVHMDCTKLFLSTLYASLRGTTAAKVRVGYVAPGHAYTTRDRSATQSAAAASALAMRDNRSRTRWSTIGTCTRSMLLNKTRCDARFYSMCFGDSKWHRAGWWTYGPPRARAQTPEPLFVIRL